MRIRDAKKLASRGRVVEAARALFEEVGFQETTVRMIAERAGLSPGGVFTTFDDKVAILAHILIEDRERLFEELLALAPTLIGSTRERIQAVIELAHRHEWPRLRMVVAYVGASYGWSRKLEEIHQRQYSQLAKVVADLLRAGVGRGEIRGDVEIDLVVQSIASMHLGCYRTAYYAGFDVDDLDDRMRRQLDMLFEGVQAPS